MNLRSEIEALERERAAAVGELEIAYRHAKRDVARKLSPSRAIRKHVGASLGLAAVAGYMLAPAKHSSGVVKKAGMVLGWGKRLLGMVVPGLADKRSEKKDEECGKGAVEEKVAPKSVIQRSLVTALLAQALSFLRQNKDIHKVLGDIVQNLKKGSGIGAAKKAAEVSAGNGGAIRGVEFEMVGRE